MSIEQSDYETLLCEYTQREGAIALLKQYRPYLEMIPSLRRPEKSLITIPLPLIKLRYTKPTEDKNHSLFSWQETIRLPCDLGILMCDPQWQIKMGSEILVFIHRPQEEFSQLLGRWRSAQILLHQEYEWLMPIGEEHIFSENAEKICPLFVVFEKTPMRIKRGLAGANLPFLIQNPDQEIFSDESCEIISDID
ncbi:conserved hypothetical protein [Gloeothece citriformis PCC 7424]|uniref:Uncharacterized protein n=1 Tax=Gloeothece citriformis (strain PCC 7424) TaxID=65393 RepID=B7KLI3_GLOC7|nr:hypothetical protein [Gloeothece citriformis]ACK72555.1 conserved hypothetical protein [Gloeothece citriformis PCC 7424]